MLNDSLYVVSRLFHSVSPTFRVERRNRGPMMRLYKGEFDKNGISEKSETNDMEQIRRICYCGA